MVYYVTECGSCCPCELLCREIFFIAFLHYNEQLWTGSVGDRRHQTEMACIILPRISGVSGTFFMVGMLRSDSYVALAVTLVLALLFLIRLVYVILVATAAHMHYSTPLFLPLANDYMFVLHDQQSKQGWTSFSNWIRRPQSCWSCYFKQPAAVKALSFPYIASCFDDGTSSLETVSLSVLIFWALLGYTVVQTSP